MATDGAVRPLFIDVGELERSVHAKWQCVDCHADIDRIPHPAVLAPGNCQRCHGKGGIGATNAPALDGKKWLQLKTGSYDEIVTIVTEGVPQASIKDATHRFAMRPRGGNMNLTDPQVQAVAAYVWTLTHK